jgi:hypothetical protein
MESSACARMAPPAVPASGANPFLELVEALANRHGEVDVHLEHLQVKVPMIREPLEVSGTVTVALKFRELTDREKQADVAREIKLHAR